MANDWPLRCFWNDKNFISNLGYPIFELLRKSTTDIDIDIYYILGKGINAKGEYNENGCVVFKNSGMYLNISKSIPNHLIGLRTTLINDKIVKRHRDHYIFTEDFQFTSLSQATGIILGRSANGWTEWKSKNGKTLDKVKRQNELRTYSELLTLPIFYKNDKINKLIVI